MTFSDIFATFRWWFVLMILGTAVIPVTYHFLKPLPDRGYAFTKMLGVLLVSFFLWLLGTLGILRNDMGGILLALALTVGISAYAIWREQEDENSSITGWLKENWQQILITELIFLVIFGVWVWVRAQNPAIAATEKPMDFAFLNSMSRSATMPPEDPWLSGFGISYYYFGYLMTSVIARLAFVPEFIAFNLGIAWLVAGTGVGAFGLVYNLTVINGKRIAAITLGIIAAVALSIAGNQQITMEVLHAHNVGSPAFWQWLDIRDINTPPNPEATTRYEGGSWWWWRSSRPIHEYSLADTPEEGLEPIVEFPGFSFLLGDLHPHVMALPFAFLSLAVAMVWWLESPQSTETYHLRTDDEEQRRFHSQFMIHHSLFVVNWPFYLFTALILGGLSFLNTWDVLIHLFIVAGAFVLARWRREGWHWGLMGQGLVTAVILLILSLILYLPFFLGFKSQAGAPYLLPMMMRPTRLVQYFVIFGMSLWVITILLLALAIRQRFRYWQQGVLTAVSLLIILLFATFFFSWILATSAEGANRIIWLANELGVTLAPRIEGTVSPLWGLTAVFRIAPIFFSHRIAFGAMTLYLTLLVALLVMIAHEQLQGKEAAAQPMVNSSETTPVLPFVLLLVLTAVLLTLGPEFVYLRDNFGQRLNTIFKFYYQAWVLFGVTALYGINYLLKKWNKGVQRIIPLAAASGYAVMLALALLFPYYGVHSRMIEYRGTGEFNEREPATLNGLAYIQRYNPNEYDAIMWLRENIDGSPVMVEAVGGQYSNYGRMAANTGIPTLLGWAGHEYQWRGSNTPEPSQRELAVRDIYSLLYWPTTQALLEYNHVSYVVVGNLERDTYGLLVNDKFADNLDVAFQNESVTIYKWNN
ncbi:MAG: hypothetical protein CSB13_00955 [Chloroflexi bacterium]|nr:MAG: hypothetical protein CSB13_00955 [Chloroflexota bacterium]